MIKRFETIFKLMIFFLNEPVNSLRMWMFGVGYVWQGDIAWEFIILEQSEMLPTNTHNAKHSNLLQQNSIKWAICSRGSQNVS